MSNSLNDLDEFDTLADPNFSPASFANDLLLATNPVSNELDLFTSIKRIGFDMNNIGSQLDKISGEEHTKLVQEIHQDSKAKDLFKQLSLPLNQINTSFQRLDKDLIQPYKEAVKLQDALRRIHQTAYLMRGVDQFLALVQKIEDITNSKNYDPLVLLKNHKTLLTLSQLLHNLDFHLTKNPILKSMKLIRDYELIKLTKSKQLVNAIQQALRQLTEKNFDVAKSPMNYFSEADVATYFQSLYLLDRKILTETVGIILNINITTSVNLLARSLSSKNLFKQTLMEVSAKGQFIGKIMKNLNKITFQDGNQESVHLFSEVSKALQIKDFSLRFWTDVSTRFQPKFNDFVNAGSITAQAFRKDMVNLQESIKDAVLKSDVKDQKGVVKDDDPRVTLMLSCISQLEQ